MCLSMLTWLIWINFMKLYNEFSNTVISNIQLENPFQWLIELHPRSSRTQSPGTKRKHITKYLNKNELMDSHPVWFNMINTSGYCLATVVHQSIVIGKKIQEEGQLILINYFGYWIWGEICIWAPKILLDY